LVPSILLAARAGGRVSRGSRRGGLARCREGGWGIRPVLGRDSGGKGKKSWGGAGPASAVVWCAVTQVGGLGCTVRKTALRVAICVVRDWDVSALSVYQYFPMKASALIF
jgi:hypothetical protein